MWWNNLRVPVGTQDKGMIRRGVVITMWPCGSHKIGERQTEVEISLRFNVRARSSIGKDSRWEEERPLLYVPPASKLESGEGRNLLT